MDNNTNSDTTADNNVVLDVAKTIAVETGKAVVVTVAQYAGAFAILTVGGVALSQTQKFKARRAAKAAAKTIETTPEIN